MLEVEPLVSLAICKSGLNSNEAVTGTTSEVFGRWLQHQYAPIKLPSARNRHIVMLRDTLFILDAS